MWEALLDIVCCNAKDTVAAKAQPLVTFSIPLRRLAMYRPVDFNDQPGRQTREVGDESPEDVLAVKPDTETSVAQRLPEKRLAMRCRPSEVPCALEQCGWLGYFDDLAGKNTSPPLASKDGARSGPSDG
jgi:hypothetical protein